MTQRSRLHSAIYSITPSRNPSRAIIIKMIVTITGTNDLLRKAELDKLVGAFLEEYGDMALERFDGEETNAERMRESIQSMPFLSPRKMVVLREPGKQKAFAEAIDD